MAHGRGDVHVDQLADELGRAGEVDHAVVGTAARQFAGILARRAFDQYALARAHHAAGNGQRTLLDHGLQALQPLHLLLVRGVVLQVGGRGAGAGAVDERVGVVVGQILGQLQCLQEIGLGLAGKAHDEVGGESDAGAGGAQATHDGTVFQCRVAALHGGQDAVGARLHGQVYQRRQLGQPGVGVDQPFGELARVRGGVADALDARDVVDVVEQRGKVGRGVEAFHLAQVGVDVLAQQRHFLHALFGQGDHVGQHVLEGAGDLLAAGVRHHAEAAVLAAAFHDGDEGAGAHLARWRQGVELLDLGKADVDLRVARLSASVDEFGQAVQGLRAEDHVDKGRARNDGLAFLAGHAAAHADDQFGSGRLHGPEVAQVGEDLLLGLLADGTGVEQDDVGLVRVVGQLGALGLGQQVGHPFAVVGVHLAPEGAQVEFSAHAVVSLRRPGRGLRHGVAGAPWPGPSVPGRGRRAVALSSGNVRSLGRRETGRCRQHEAGGVARPARWRGRISGRAACAVPGIPLRSGSRRS